MPETKRSIERLARKQGASFYGSGRSHDIWVTKDGRKFAIPRHPGDLTPGVERSIKKVLGLT